MKIVLVEPGKEAREAEITGSLREMQKLVGGIIQAIYPWTDPVAMICHDEGKILGLPFNRVLEDYDLIAGPFFICGIQGENFASLTDQQVKTYLEKFRRPQIICRTPVGLMVKSCSEQEYAALHQQGQKGTPPKENMHR